MRDETKCLHAGYSPKNSEPRVMPIVQSTTYVYDSTADVAAVFDDPTKSLIYSRFANPTVMAVEDKIAALEGGVGAMCTTSGQAANLMAVLNICEAGDSLISVTQIYGGTINLFSFTLKKLGIECIYVSPDATDEELDRAFKRLGIIAQTAAQNHADIGLAADGKHLRRRLVDSLHFIHHFSSSRKEVPRSGFARPK